jgi:formylglycine-generating enzyme required for sulfatase activity
MYGISEDVHIDETYLSIMKALWDSSPRPPKPKPIPKPLPKPIPKPPKNIFRVGNVEFRMNPVEGGSFMMGEKENAHKVSLSSYKIGETPVTQELWQVVMGDNPSKFKGEKRPVEQVSWDDCQKFINKLNQLTGKDFRLPTEAEWEFAARGGNRSLKTLYSGGINLDDVAWYNLNCSENEDSGLNYGTHDVKAKAPNELRIYDMSGNVWEWCQDTKTKYGKDPQTNPLSNSPDYYNLRVFRGGSFVDSGYCVVTYRGGYNRQHCCTNYGLRLAITNL